MVAAPADAGPARPDPAAHLLQQGDEGLEVEGTSTYELVPDGSRVHVTVEIEITNTERPVNLGSFIQYSYLDVFSLPMLEEAEGVVARTDGRSLAVDVVEEAELVSFAVVDVEPDVEFGSPRTVTVEYDLPAQPPRAESFTRINEAFVSFGMFAIGDPGAADVVVVLPNRFDVEFVGEQPSLSPRDGRTTYRFDDVAEPGNFFTTVAARDDDALVDVDLEVAGAEIVIRAWPGDSEWAEFVSDTLREGIPVLEELTGEDWPAGQDLEVIESASPYLYGYSGWFLPAEDLIEMGDELDARVVLHEIGHLWFNDDLFRGRWISEGFAEAFANRVLERRGDEGAEPTPPDPADPGAQPLEEWSDPDLLDQTSEETERYGYATSFLVVDRLLDDVGEKRMREVLRAAERREISYVGAGDPERLLLAPDWRRFLDLLVDRAGSERAEELFARRVVAAEDRALFERRTQARKDYEAFAAASDGWSPPYPLRVAMTEWEFTQAEELFEDARAFLARRDALLDDPVLGLDRVRGLERAYESAETVDDVDEAFDVHESVAATVAEAADLRDDPVGPLGFLAHLGDPAGSRIDRARGALERGEPATARRHAEAAIGISDDANAVGAVRLLAVCLVLAVLVLLQRVRRFVLRRPASQDIAQG